MQKLTACPQVAFFWYFYWKNARMQIAFPAIFITRILFIVHLKANNANDKFKIHNSYRKIFYESKMEFGILAFKCTYLMEAITEFRGMESSRCRHNSTLILFKECKCIWKRTTFDEVKWATIWPEENKGVRSQNDIKQILSALLHRCFSKKYFTTRDMLNIIMRNCAVNANASLHFFSMFWLPNQKPC